MTSVNKMMQYGNRANVEDPSNDRYRTIRPTFAMPESALNLRVASMTNYFAAQESAGTYEVIPHRIFVGGFAPTVTEEDLRKVFEEHGQIREVKVVRNTDNGISKGYGFVTFENDEEARAVRTSSVRFEIEGRRLNLGPAMRRIQQNPRFSSMSLVANNNVGLSGTPSLVHGGVVYPSLFDGSPYVTAAPQPWQNYFTQYMQPQQYQPAFATSTPQPGFNPPQPAAFSSFTPSQTPYPAFGSNYANPPPNMPPNVASLSAPTPVSRFTQRGYGGRRHDNKLQMQPSNDYNSSWNASSDSSRWSQQMMMSNMSGNDHGGAVYGYNVPYENIQN